jgi:hypothetical protein
VTEFLWGMGLGVGIGFWLWYRPPPLPDPARFQVVLKVTQQRSGLYVGESDPVLYHGPVSLVGESVEIEVLQPCTVAIAVRK